ncbi:hypothetical protein K438DRAFT_1781082 [Mycena galopus ATCC 62051]|nr:hypothetical protein K438DRAFT_1781082 [Mycena galopus ATCC 62051]
MFQLNPCKTQRVMRKSVARIEIYPKRWKVEVGRGDRQSSAQLGRENIGRPCRGGSAELNRDLNSSAGSVDLAPECSVYTPELTPLRALGVQTPQPARTQRTFGTQCTPSSLRGSPTVPKKREPHVISLTSAEKISPGAGPPTAQNTGPPDMLVVPVPRLEVGRLADGAKDAQRGEAVRGDVVGAESGAWLVHAVPQRFSREARKDDVADRADALVGEERGGGVPCHREVDTHGVTFDG